MQNLKATRKLLSKSEWSKARGSSPKSRRLRGCRKHVYNKHGWYYYFDCKPDISTAFPESLTRNEHYTRRPIRSNTSMMSSFVPSCKFAVDFKSWMQSPGGGGKNETQSDQICSKVLKLLKQQC